MEEWNKYYDEANSYSKAAFGAFNKKKLGNHVIYNLIGLSIESYLTALCMNLNMMPEHSSVGSMLALLKKQIQVPDSFSVESRFMNKFMNFCSLEVLETPEPSDSDLVRMLSFMDDIRNFITQNLGVETE